MIIALFCLSVVELGLDYSRLNPYRNAMAQAPAQGLSEVVGLLANMVRDTASILRFLFSFATAVGESRPRLVFVALLRYLANLTPSTTNWTSRGSHLHLSSWTWSPCHCQGASPVRKWSPLRLRIPGLVSESFLHWVSLWGCGRPDTGRVSNLFWSPHPPRLFLPLSLRRRLPTFSKPRRALGLPTPQCRRGTKETSSSPSPSVGCTSVGLRRFGRPSKHVESVVNQNQRLSSFWWSLRCSQVHPWGRIWLVDAWSCKVSDYAGLTE